MFPGQVAERGGEFIDNLRQDDAGVCTAIQPDARRLPERSGDGLYFFNAVLCRSCNSRRIPITAAGNAKDLIRMSKAPTADSFNGADALLDEMSLSEYLDTRGAGPLAKAAITAAYEAEYGLRAGRQSCLNRWRPVYFSPI
jgi:monoamine oxidase